MSGAIIVQQAQAGRDILIAKEIHIHNEADKPLLSALHQLPPSPANFIGRDDELAELEKKLTTKRTSGATISGTGAGLQGMGGVGKTALATILAHRLENRFPDAQLYLNLRGVDPDHRAPVTPSEAMRDIIHTFRPEAKLPEEPDKLMPIYHGVLNEAGRVLLFFDNASGADQIRPLLPPSNCFLLVTSRAQFTLPGLEQCNIDCLKPEKSQELLRRLAPRINGNEKDAAELCGHLPLALEVFAGVVNGKILYPVPELLKRFHVQQDKLASVDAAFQLSYELLTEELRKHWVLLSVFSAGFDLPAVAAVWETGTDGARAAMQTLVNTSLVEFNEINGRFRLHDLVRKFCSDKLSDVERNAAHFHHARHYCEVGDDAEQLYLKGGEDAARGLALFDRERIHIESAFDWLWDRRDQNCTRLLVALVNSVAYTASLRFQSHQRIQWLECQRDAARVIKDREAESAALGNLGIAYAQLGDVQKAIEFYEREIVIDREIGNRDGEGAGLCNLGNAYADLGNTRKAIEFYMQGLAIHREVADRRGEVIALCNLGKCCYSLGDAPKAIEFYNRALVIARTFADRHGEGLAVGNLGTAYAHLRNTRKAIESYEQALLIHREIGDRHGEGYVLNNLGLAYADSGDRHKATELYKQALAIARNVGNRQVEMNALSNLGNA